MECRRFGLEGHMANAEAVPEEGREVGEDVFGAGDVGKFDVGTEGRERRGD
jgi:hypothetical protein